MVRTRGQSIGEGGGVATGIYTGNGAATQAIVGVGFGPRYLIVFRNTTVMGNTRDMCMKADVDGGSAFFHYFNLNLWYYHLDDIISLDADGFTVGDGTIWGANDFNMAGQIYTYIAFR